MYSSLLSINHEDKQNAYCLLKESSELERGLLVLFGLCKDGPVRLHSILIVIPSHISTTFPCKALDNFM